MWFMGGLGAEFGEQMLCNCIQHHRLVSLATIDIVMHF
jgi:hypothetical protein